MIRAPATASGSDTVALVVTDRVAIADWSAPTSLAAERTLARLLYRGLIRIDCAGRPLPDLAVSWKSLQNGAIWEFVLPSELQFADGNPLTSAAVQASLARRPLPWIEAVEVRGDYVLRVRLAVPSATVPAAFGSSSAAIVGASRPTGLPPIESGDYRWAGRVGAGRGGQTITLVRWRATGSPSEADTPQDGPSVLRVGVDRQADPRDRFDLRGGDPIVMITRDPATVEYGQGRVDLRVESLGWDLEYGLVFRPGLAAGTPSDSERVALARDAVGADLRPATDSLCPATSATMIRPSRRLVAFEEVDPIARRLAERIVALLGSRSQPAWLTPGSGDGRYQTAGFRAGALDTAVATGAVELAVVGRPRPLEGSGCPAASMDRTTGWVGLVESRSYLILGGGAPSLEREADGTLRLTGAGHP